MSCVERGPGSEGRPDQPDQPDQRGEGLAAAYAGRRALIGGAGAGLVFSAALGAGPAARAAGAAPARRTRKRAYVLVIDGCRPEEIDEGLTPNLRRLRSGGLRFGRASSLPVMETIPNHTMMMSGMRPRRTGVPANAVYDRDLGEVRTLDQPTDLRVPTLLDRMDARGFRTGSVLSKEYLYGIFGTRATYRWEPMPIIPVSGHAPDQFTMQAALDMVEQMDPHLVFVNLGDIDRFGHSDITGTTLRLARRTALADTDRLVGDFVTMLRDTGRWEHAMVLVLADHSMDWSRPDRVVSLSAPLEADPFLAGRVAIADNGGADLLYWLGAAGQRAEAVRRMRAVAESVEGVLTTRDRRDRSLQLGPEAGEVVAYCEAGWRFSDPDPVTSNPIPGNHGHPATRPIPFFIGGGHPRVPRRRASSLRARTVDVAPTVGDFFGFPAPRQGYQGHSVLP